MNKHPEIRRYLKGIEEELSDIDDPLKKSIIKEIEDHLEEKLQGAKNFFSDSEISPEEIKKILEEFGEPEEIAREYRRQLSEGDESFYNRKKTPTKYIILPVVITVIVISSIFAGLLLLGGEEKEDNNTIYGGIGLTSIKIGDDLDKILSIFGEPEDRVNSSYTIWLGYREKEGIDFLLSNESNQIIEIRFNPGFQGSFENGISIGSKLDEVLNLSGGATINVRVNVSEAQNYSYGWDSVLYEVVDVADETISYKFIDAKKGILFWFDSNGVLTQIIVFHPF
jgi:hypothetical protein